MPTISSCIDPLALWAAEWLSGFGGVVVLAICSTARGAHSRDLGKFSVSRATPFCYIFIDHWTESKQMKRQCAMCEGN